MRIVRNLQHSLRVSSLKTKLVLIITAVTVTSLILSGAFILSYEISRAKKVSVQDMMTLSEITASTSTAALVFSDRKSINEYLGSLNRRSDVIAACIYDTNHQIFGKFIRSGSAVECPDHPDKDGLVFDEGPVLKIIEPIQFEDRRIGTIFIASDLGYLRSELVFQVTLIGTVLIVVAAFAMLLSGWIQRYVSYPILSLAQTAKAISRNKDYSIRVHVTRHDEIGYLIDAFNTMLTQIDSQDKSLRNSTQILQSVLNSMGDAVVVVDRDGRVIIWNDSARQLMGEPADVSLDQWTKTYGLYRGDQKTPYPTDRLPLVRAMRGEFVDQDELYFNREGVQPAYVSVTARPLVGGGEKVRGAVSVVRDVTEKKHLQSEQERLLRETQEAVRIRDEFMSIASHELKTPLAPLRTQVQILQRLSKTNQLKQYPPDKLEKLMSFTDSQVKRLVSLIENLLDVTRITSGKLNLNLENVRLAPLVRDILDQHRQEIQRTGSPIKTEMDESIEAYWDRYRIEQVLVNLLTNALKYGNGKEIRIATRALPDCVIISVQDQGIGIAEEDQKRIFGRFERAVSMAHYGGLGLGLYISKQIVAAHGGTIRLESQVGRGSSFIVELPWRVGAEASPQSAA